MSPVEIVIWLFIAFLVGTTSFYLGTLAADRLMSYSLLFWRFIKR